MAVSCGFFDSVGGDRKYSAAEMSQFYDSVITEGVFQNFKGGLAVSAGTGLSVSVAAGRANVQSRWLLNDSALTLSIDAASTTYGRIDAVVIRLSESSRNISIVVKKGTPASSPVAPSLTRSGGTYEMALAYVTVAANASSVSVTDKRSDSSLCGWAAVREAVPGEIDAQLEAMKTGFDGVVYPSPAAMVRGEDEKLDNKIDDVSEFLIEGDTTTLISGKYVNGTTGGWGDNASWTMIVSKVYPGQTISFTWNGVKNYAVQYAFYTTNPIVSRSGYVSGANSTSYTVTAPNKTSTDKGYFYIAACINEVKTSGEIITSVKNGVISETIDLIPKSKRYFDEFDTLAWGADVEIYQSKYVDGNSGAIGSLSGWTLAVVKVLAGEKITATWDTTNVIAQYAFYTTNPITDRSGYVSGANGGVYYVTAPTSANVTYYYLAICTNTVSETCVVDYALINGIIDQIKKNSANILYPNYYGKKVVWLGTSIPEGNVRPAYGYPNVIADDVNFTVFNNAIGASKIRKGISSRVTETNPCGIGSAADLRNLCQTIEEKQYNNEHWEDICNELQIEYVPLTDAEKTFYISTSYENLVDPYLSGDNKADLFVINHGFNDHIADFAQNPPTEYDLFYFKGAMNFIIHRIIEGNPNAKVIIFGHYQNRSDLLFDTVFKELATKWNIYYFPLWQYLGWSAEEVTATKRVNASGEWTTITSTSLSVKDQWIYDGTHPKGVARDRIAEVSLPLFKYILN